MDNLKIKELCHQYDELKRIKLPLEQKYDVISKFLFPVVLDSSLTTSGETPNTTPTLVSKTFFADGTAYKALTLMASAIMGSMWPNGARSIQIVPPYMFSKRNELTEQEKLYYEFITDITVSAMDHPRANLSASLREYMMQAGAYGTSGVGCYDGPDANNPVIYRSYCAKDLYISSDHQGRVDEIFIRQVYTVKNLVQKFGYTRVSPQVRKLFDDTTGGAEEKRVVIQYIGPRVDYDPNKRNAKNMPIASIYFEHDTKHALRESGFAEMPIMVGRFERVVGSDYGISPALAALSDISDLNVQKELFTQAAERLANPITNIYSDSMLNAEQYDDRPGARNNIVTNGRMDGQKPVEYLQYQGDITPISVRMTELVQSITDHFHIDKLLDLNNETMMTATETLSREKLRGEAINSIFNRQETDLFNPLIEATVNRLFAQGLLGVIEDSPEYYALFSQGVEPVVIPPRIAAMIQGGMDFFDIKYISPAARIRKTDELQGLTRALEKLSQILPLLPELADEIGVNMLWPKLVELEGAPIEIIEAKDKIEQKRQSRAQMQQMQMDAELGRNQSEIARNVGNAVSSVSRKGG